MTINYKKHDPHYASEKSAYKNPVPSREFIRKQLEKYGKPASFEYFLEVFKLKKPELKEGIYRRLRAMERDGELILNRAGRYTLIDETDLIAGRVQSTREGYGFLIPDNGEDDIFLPARQMDAIFNGDRVLVRKVKGREGKSAGVIVEVVESKVTQLVGRFFKEGELAFVTPDDRHIHQDILIPPKHRLRARSGQYVLIDILKPPVKRRQPIGKIVEVLGDHLTPGVEIELAMRSHGIPHEWPEAVEKQARKIKPKVQKKDLADREDLRDKFFVTIDGDDAKDFDDAVYCEARKKGGWDLWVAIADVAHYVQPGSALDQEAQLRGNSTYFPGCTVPMLPEVLSNGLCSLNPEVDRLTMVCRMHISADGVVKQYHFSNAVIHSKARLTYVRVAKMLEGKDNTTPEVLPHVHTLYQLFLALQKQRKRRGAIEFDSLESKIIFDKKGKIARIEKRGRNDAHRLIEEMMLAANESAAKFVQKMAMPALYRNHDEPKEAKLEKVDEFLQGLGLRLGGKQTPSAMDYTQLLQKIRGRVDQDIIEMVLLRSLSQANYGPENIGHFGLAFAEYAHFTSPIRRYPDLLLHRTLKHLILKQHANTFGYSFEDMEKLGSHCSETERRSDLAVRDATDWLKCYYMKDKVGESYEGVISDVTGFGFFVELTAIFVHGLVHMTALPNDYYHFDPVQHTLTAKRSGQQFKVGQPVKVLVTRVDLDERKIDFSLVE